MIVVWDKDDFLDYYPQFVGKVTDSVLEKLWIVATTLIPNTENSPIPYDPDQGIYVRKLLLYALMCHMITVQLNDSVGAVTSATEGSVSASVTIPTAKGYFQQWLNSTPCGQLAWLLMRKYTERGGKLYVSNHRHPWA